MIREHGVGYRVALIDNTVLFCWVVTDSAPLSSVVSEGRMDANNQDGVFISERFLSQKGQKGPLRMHQDSSQVRPVVHWSRTYHIQCCSFLQPFA